MDLGRFDCGACPSHRRKLRGCEGGATAPHFFGTPYFTDVCPRRHLLRNPDLAAVLSLHRALGDEPIGFRGLDELSGQAVDALAVIAGARAARLDEELSRARKEAGHE